MVCQREVVKFPGKLGNLSFEGFRSKKIEPLQLKNLQKSKFVSFVRSDRDEALWVSSLEVEWGKTRARDPGPIFETLPSFLMPKIADIVQLLLATWC